MLTVSNQSKASPYLSRGTTLRSLGRVPCVGCAWLAGTACCDTAPAVWTFHHLGLASECPFLAAQLPANDKGDDHSSGTPPPGVKLAWRTFHSQRWHFTCGVDRIIETPRKIEMCVCVGEFKYVCWIKHFIYAQIMFMHISAEIKACISAAQRQNQFI